MRANDKFFMTAVGLIDAEEHAKRAKEAIYSKEYTRAATQIALAIKKLADAGEELARRLYQRP